MRFSSTIAPLVAATVATAGKVPAVQRPYAGLSLGSSSSNGVSKRSTCIDGNIASWQCCSDSWYCEPNEFCVGSFFDYCCPQGSTFLAGSYECQLPNGGESDAFPDVDPEESGWINNNGVLTTAPYYVSVVTIHYTSYYSTYDYDIERPFLTSEVEDDTTTLSIATTDSAAASSYISSSSSYLVSYYSSYYAYESSSLSRQGLAPASFITLGSASSTPAPTGAAAATGNGTASSSSSSSSSSTSSAKSTTKSSSSTSAATASTTPGAGNNSSASASPTAVPKNAASSARASGFETLIASGLTIMAIGSGLSAFLL